MRHIWLAAAAATAIATGAHAAPLTFDAALKLADQSAPSLQAKASEIRAVRSSAIAAGRLPDPKLAVGVEGFPVSGPNAWRPQRDDFSAVGVGLIQDVPNGAKRQAARDRAAADIGAAEAGGKVEARTVRLSTALAWIDLYYAERRLAALDEVEQTLKSLRAAAPGQLASGASRPAETLQADQLTAELGDRRSDMVAAIGKARAALARWTGDPEVDVVGDPPSYDVDSVKLRVGLEDVPSLRAYDAMSRQAEADVTAAKADKRPDWSWELGYQHRDPRFGDMVMVQATVSLPFFASTRQDPVIAARTELASRVRSEREAARRGLTASLDTDLADHLMHHDRLHRALETLVPLARRRLDLETASYAAGTATLADALGASISLVGARVDALDREADVARDAVRIVLTYEGDAQ